MLPIGGRKPTHNNVAVVEHLAARGAEARVRLPGGGPRPSDLAKQKGHSPVAAFLRRSSGPAAPGSTQDKECDVNTRAGCDDRSKEYIGKHKEEGVERIRAERKRLEGVRGGDMKPDKRIWISRRVTILDGLEKLMKHDEL